MMDAFLNILKGQSAALDQTQGQPRFGLVTSFDPNTYTARVTLQPEGVLTGWLPVLSPWTGSGWGMVAPPSPGDQVVLIAQEGQADHGIIIGRAFSDAARPPSIGGKPAPSGEIWLVHASGSFLILRNDGSIAGQATTWRLAGNMQITGNVEITGTLTVSADIYDGHGPLSGLRTHYDAHTHTDSIGGRTSLPTPQD
jgi:phage baseplate assembly protein gpV